MATGAPSRIPLGRAPPDPLDFLGLREGGIRDGQTGRKKGEGKVGEREERGERVKGGVEGRNASGSDQVLEEIDTPDTMRCTRVTSPIFVVLQIRLVTALPYWLMRLRKACNSYMQCNLQIKLLLSSHHKYWFLYSIAEGQIGLQQCKD